MPRSADQLRLLTRVQYGFAAAVGLTAVAALLVDGAPADGIMPAWLDVAIVAGAGAYVSFVARYWRIRPVPQWRLTVYATAVAIRTVLALGPALVSIVVRAAGGHHIAIAVGLAWSATLLWSLRPTGGDLDRHIKLWTEIGFVPPESIWGTADPDSIPPWEDPDGGHGHEMFHTH